MIITDELRDYARGWRDRKCYEHLLAIADRIDEQHAKARDKAYDEGVCDGIDADKNAMGYVKWPVDADGVIHAGDKITDGMNEHEVWSIVFYKDRVGVEDAYGEFDGWESMRHVKPDSWERIIGDAIAEGYERINLTDIISESNDELIARCKKLAEKESHAGA